MQIKVILVILSLVVLTTASEYHKGRNHCQDLRQNPDFSYCFDDNEYNCGRMLNNLQERITDIEDILQSNKVGACGVGMQDGRIQENQITSNGYAQDNEGHSHKWGRLYEDKGGQAWCAAKSDYMWIQLDMGRVRKIHGVVLQGRGSYDQWVTSYRVEYRKKESDDLEFAMNAANHQHTFQGSFDRNTLSFGRFEEGISARFVRIVPLTYSGWPSLRFELLLC